MLKPENIIKIIILYRNEGFIKIRIYQIRAILGVIILSYY